MRILLSNHQLTARSGSELATCELARGLAARGHDVAVFTFFKGALAEQLIREHGIPVFDDTQADQIILFGAEIVHTHHAPCAHFLRLYTMGAVRIHGMLGVLTPLEAPPLDADVFSLGLAISEEVAERIAFTPFNTTPIEIFRNWFDDPGAASLAPPDLAGPIKVAVVSNHVAPELATALTELRAAGEIEPEYFGIESVSAVIDSKLLSRYGIVVSIGRTALMAAACGRPCIMADIHGSDGLLTAETIDRAMRSNFSGRATRTPITAAHLATEIERARSTDLSGLRDRVLREFSIEQRLDFLERRYVELLASPDRRPADRGDWPAEGAAYAELAARVRHAEHLLAVERTAKSSATDALAAEIDTLAHLIDAQSEQLDHLQSEVARYRSVAESTVGSSKQDAHVIDHLQRTLASRDEAIAWLQAELAFARRRGMASRPPRRGVRSVLRSALGELAKRSPLLRTAVRSAIPLPIRERLHGLLSGRDAPAKPSHTELPAPIVSGGRFDALPGRFDIICYANIEWAARFQRPQQMMLQFARAGHRIFYVVASRKPLDGATYSVEQIAENVVQVALSVDALPDHYAEAMSPDAHASYASSLAALAQNYGIYAPVQIVHLPFWTPLALDFQKTRRWRVAYDCMDEWDSFPKIGAPLLAAEQELVREADLVTVTSQLLLEKWQEAAPKAMLIRNGVDNAFFAERLAPSTLLAGISRPIIGYYGALAEWVDFQLLADLADASPEWSFVLIGDHFTGEVDLLKSKPNVHLLGLRPYADMPRYLFNFDACLIPFKLNKITHAVDPVKFYEYLAGGKPVVSTPLEELRPFGEYVSFAETADGFKRALADHLAHDTPEKAEARRAFAAQNDWRQRFETYSNALTAQYPMVSVVVVTYGNLDLTRLCLGSVLRDTEHPRFEVIIVDNASTDGTPDYLRALAADHENVRIVLNDANRGFAAANNQGLALASGDVLVLLNNDTVVPRGWLSGLLAHLEDAEIGLLGPVTNAVGNEAKVVPDYADITGLQPYADQRRHTLSGRHFDIRMLAMFCLAMRRDVFERLGPLDENYGVGMFEDDDYSMRAKAAGYRIVCAEDVYIHHFGQAAFKKLIENGEYDALWQRNQAYFESKWGSWQPHVHRTPA